MSLGESRNRMREPRREFPVNFTWRERGTIQQDLRLDDRRIDLIVGGEFGIVGRVDARTIELARGSRKRYQSRNQNGAKSTAKHTARSEIDQAQNVTAA
jgi:hypothetical protein